MLITHLLLVLEVCNVKLTYRKLWAGNLLMWSDLTLGPSYMRRGQPNLKVLITCLLLILEVCNVKATHRKSWAGNLLMLLDFTFGSFFKVFIYFLFMHSLFLFLGICSSHLLRSCFFCLLLVNMYIFVYL